MTDPVIKKLASTLHHEGLENWFLTKMVIKIVSVYRVFLLKNNLNSWKHYLMLFKMRLIKVKDYPRGPQTLPYK